LLCLDWISINVDVDIEIDINVEITRDMGITRQLSAITLQVHA